MPTNADTEQLLSTVLPFASGCITTDLQLNFGDDTVVPTQKVLCRSARALYFETMGAQFRANSDLAGYGWFLSGAFPASWLNSATRSAAVLRLDAASFKRCVCLRLQVQPVEWHTADINIRSECASCRRCQNDELSHQLDLFHGMACHATQRSNIARHDAVQQAFVSFLKRHFPGRVQLQVPLSAGHTTVIADFALRLSATEVFYFDVTIGTPTILKHLPADFETSCKLSAATKMEHDKMARYRDVLEQLNITVSSFYPLAIETSGHLGPATERFLEWLFDKHHVSKSELKFLRDRVQTILCRFNAGMTAKYLDSRIELTPLVSQSNSQVVSIVC
jgi:hypothetical protein